MPGGGLPCDIRGVCAIWGRLMGVACDMFGVALGILGVPDGWLCWLPRADMLVAIAADMGGWFWTTEDGRGGLPPMLEVECCMATFPTIGDDMLWGVCCRTIGDEAVGWETWWKRPCAWAGIELGMPFCMGPLAAG